MNYEETIKLIDPLLKMHGFSIVESFKNYTRYQSKRVSVIIGFNDKENSYVVFAGRNDRSLIELWWKVYEEFFDVDFQAIQGESFSEKFINFLKGSGNFILLGDLDKLNDLEKYSLKSDHKYTKNIVDQQNLTIADKAWSENNYAKFIKYINLVSFDFLPNSYLLKRKIAQRKLAAESSSS